MHLQSCNHCAEKLFPLPVRTSVTNITHRILIKAGREVRCSHRRSAIARCSCNHSAEKLFHLPARTRIVNITHIILIAHGGPGDRVDAAVSRTRAKRHFPRGANDWGEITRTFRRSAGISVSHLRFRLRGSYRFSLQRRGDCHARKNGEYPTHFLIGDCRQNENLLSLSHR